MELQTAESNSNNNMQCHKGYREVRTAGPWDSVTSRRKQWKWSTSFLLFIQDQAEGRVPTPHFDGASLPLLTSTQSLTSTSAAEQTLPGLPGDACLWRDPRSWALALIVVEFHKTGTKPIENSHQCQGPPAGWFHPTVTVTHSKAKFQSAPLRASNREFLKNTVI